MRTVDFDRNVDMLVRCSDGNRDIFEEGPCWLLRTRRCDFLSGIFSGKESATLHDHLLFGRFRCVLLFPLKISGNIVECGCQLSETSLCTKTDLCSSCRTRGPIICFTRNSNLYILKRSCILHLVKLGHSKRDWEYRRVYG